MKMLLLNIAIIAGVLSLAHSTPYNYHGPPVLGPPSPFNDYHQNDEALISIDKLYDDEFDTLMPAASKDQEAAKKKDAPSDDENAKRNVLRDALKEYGSENVKDWLNNNDEESEESILLRDIAREAFADMHGKHADDSSRTKHMDPLKKKELIKKLTHGIVKDMKMRKDGNIHAETKKDKIKEMIEDQIKKRIAERKEAVKPTPAKNILLDIDDELREKMEEKIRAAIAEREDAKSDERLVLHDIAREVAADMKGEHVEDSDSTKSIDEDDKREILHKLAKELVQDKLKRKDDNGNQPKTKQEKLRELIEDDIFSKIKGPSHKEMSEKKDAKSVILHELARSIVADTKGETYEQSDELKNIDAATKKEVLHALAHGMVKDMRKQNDDSPADEHEKLKRLVENAIMKKINARKDNSDSEDAEKRSILLDISDEQKKKIEEKIRAAIAEREDAKSDERSVLHDIAREVAADMKGEHVEDSDSTKSIDEDDKREILHKLAKELVQDKLKRKDDNGNQPKTKQEKLRELIEDDIFSKIKGPTSEKKDAKSVILHDLARSIVADTKGETYEQSDELKNIDAATKKEVLHALAHGMVKDMRKQNDDSPADEHEKLKQLVENAIMKKINARKDNSDSEDAEKRSILLDVSDEQKKKIEEKIRAAIAEREDAESDERSVLHDIAREVAADMKGEHVEDSDSTKSIDEDDKREILHKLAKELVQDKLKRKDDNGNQPKTKQEKLRELIEDDIFSKIKGPSHKEMSEKKDATKEVLHELASEFMSDIRGEEVKVSDDMKNIDEQTKRKVFHKLAKEMVNDMNNRNGPPSPMPSDQRDELKRVIEDDIMARLKQKDEKKKEITSQLFDEKLSSDEKREVRDEIKSLLKEKMDFVQDDWSKQ